MASPGNRHCANCIGAGFVPYVRFTFSCMRHREQYFRCQDVAESICGRRRVVCDDQSTVRSLVLMLAARTDRQRGVNCCSRNNWSVNSSVACMTQYNQPDIKMHCVGNEPRTNTKKCSILRSIFYKIRVCAAIRSLAIRQWIPRDRGKTSAMLSNKIQAYRVNWHQATSPSHLQMCTAAIGRHVSPP